MRAWGQCDVQGLWDKNSPCTLSLMIGATGIRKKCYICKYVRSGLFGVAGIAADYSGRG